MNSGNLTMRKSALISGVSLIVMAVLAGVANFQVVEFLKAAMKSGATGEIFLSMATPGRLAAMAFVIVAILDLIVAWSLFELFRPEQQALALLTAWFRLVYTAILAVSIVFLFATFRLAQSSPESAIESFQLFDESWMLGLIFFGVHLILLGWMILRSLHIHWIFGVLMIIAGLGYIFDSFMVLLAPESGFKIAVFTFIGEVVFIFWLLIKGARVNTNS